MLRETDITLQTWLLLNLSYPLNWFTTCQSQRGTEPQTKLTLIVHSPTKSNKGKWGKCAKPDYIIERGLAWEQNGCPGSDTRVACHSWTVHCGVGGPSSKPGWNPLFLNPPFPRRESRNEKGAWELGLSMFCALKIILLITIGILKLIVWKNSKIVSKSQYIKPFLSYSDQQQLGLLKF